MRRNSGVFLLASVSEQWEPKNYTAESVNKEDSTKVTHVI